MPRSIVVIGGGITGAFSAYHLARSGAEVTLLERADVGGAASGHNAGGLNPLHGPGIPGPMEELALTSLREHLEIWPELSGADGAPFGGRSVPRLQVAITAEEAARLADAQRLYAAVDGFSARLLSAGELRDCEAAICADAVAGLLTAGNARVDSQPYTRAIVRAAQRRGAQVVRDEACGLLSAGDRVTGVELVSGAQLRCDGVIVATGAWSREPARWLSVELPVTPVKGELLLVELGSARPELEVTWRNCGLYAGPPGCAWLGGTEEPAGFDSTPTAEGRERILAGINRLLPGLTHWRVRAHVAGLRPVTPDGVPIVGMVSENACVALGSGRKGMLYGAAMGRAAAELLLEGATALPVTACAPERSVPV